MYTVFVGSADDFVDMVLKIALKEVWHNFEVNLVRRATCVVDFTDDRGITFGERCIRVIKKRAKGLCSSFHYVEDTIQCLTSEFFSRADTYMHSNSYTLYSL